MIRKLDLVLCCAILTDLSAVCGQKDSMKTRFTSPNSDLYFSSTNIVTLTLNNKNVTETTTSNHSKTSTDLGQRVMAKQHQTSTAGVFTIKDSLTTTTTGKNDCCLDLEDQDRPGDSGSGERSPQQQLVSQEDYRKIMSVLEVVLIVVEVVSLLLTATSARVYALRTMRCTTAVYLVAMNLADTLGGALVTWSLLWRYVGGPQAVRTLAFNYLTVAGTNYLALSSRRCVYCLSVIVSMERFFVISFPLRARSFKIIQFPKLTVLALMLIVFSFHIYLPLKYQVVDSSTGGYRMGYTGNYKQNTEVFDVVSNSAKFLFSYIPLCFGLAVSLALLVALKRHAITRASLQEMKMEEEKLKQIRSSERQLARTIWLSTFLFTLLSMPSNTVHLVSTYHDTFGYLKAGHWLFMLVSRFSYLALVFSRYTNFLSYMCLSTAFRRNLLGMLPGKIATSLVQENQKRESSGK